jgi:hypothetical protein
MGEGLEEGDDVVESMLVAFWGRKRAGRRPQEIGSAFWEERESSLWRRNGFRCRKLFRGAKRSRQGKKMRPFPCDKILRAIGSRSSRLAFLMNPFYFRP